MGLPCASISSLHFHACRSRVRLSNSYYFAIHAHRHNSLTLAIVLFTSGPGCMSLSGIPQCTTKACCDRGSCVRLLPGHHLLGVRAPLLRVSRQVLVHVVVDTCFTQDRIRREKRDEKGRARTERTNSIAIASLSDPTRVHARRTRDSGAIMVDNGDVEYGNFFTAMFAVMFGGFGVGQVSACAR